MERMMTYQEFAVEAAKFPMVVVQYGNCVQVEEYKIVPAGTMVNCNGKMLPHLGGAEMVNHRRMSPDGLPRFECVNGQFVRC